MTKKFGFTLAEVMITLGIIGVVAALTMPTLIQKQEELSRVTALKKVYSVLSNAYNLAIAENGGSNDLGAMPYTCKTDGNGVAVRSDGVNCDDVYGDSNTDKLVSFLKPYLKISKECNHGETGCFSIEHRVTMQAGRRKSFILNDGTLLLMNLTGSGATFTVDVNGFKKPNKFGYDIFQFGTNVNSPVIHFHDDRTGAVKCYNNLNSTNDDGQTLGCAAWVIINGNQDYLHCDDLSWNGKTKCD